MQKQRESDSVLLKTDLFGEVRRFGRGDSVAIARDTRSARWWLRWLARRLMRREARALAALASLQGVPKLIESDDYQLVRTFMPGVPLHEGRPKDAAYFAGAARLLRRMHCAGVVHNDLAKEANLLVLENGSAAIIDFQLAAYSRSRSRWFRTAAREDIRHLLKHKRSYRPDLLSAREQAILAAPSAVSRVYMATVKPAYLFVTRRLLGWADREGAADR